MGPERFMGGVVTEFKFEDRDGVAWRVVWRPAGVRARAAGGRSEVDVSGPAGFEFTCEAVRFHAPWPAYTDPRAMRAEVLQRMVDRALGD